MRTNVSCGRSKRRGSQNIRGERTTPAGSRAPSVSGEGARGDEIARNGRNDSTSSRQARETVANCGGRFGRFSYQELRKRDKRSIRFRTYPASLDTLKVSVPPAVKPAAAICARPAPDPDIIAAVVTQLGRRGWAFKLSKTFKLPSRCIDAPLAQLRTATLRSE